MACNLVWALRIHPEHCRTPRTAEGNHSRIKVVEGKVYPLTFTFPFLWVEKGFLPRLLAWGCSQFRFLSSHLSYVETKIPLPNWMLLPYLKWQTKLCFLSPAQLSWENVAWILRFMPLFPFPFLHHSGVTSTWFEQVVSVFLESSVMQPSLCSRSLKWATATASFQCGFFWMMWFFLSSTWLPHRPC